MGYATWEKALARLFTALPLDAVYDGHGPRSDFGDCPGVIVGLSVIVAAVRARCFLASKRSRCLR